MLGMMGLHQFVVLMMPQFPRLGTLMVKLTVVVPVVKQVGQGHCHAIRRAGSVRPSGIGVPLNLPTL